MKTSRIPESLAHSCVGLFPSTTSLTVASAGALSTCESKPMLVSFDFVTRPASGVSIPDIIFISVLFPLPFLPTIPMRSPSDMPSETRSNSARISKAFETSSKLRRLRAMETERTFQP